MSDLFISHDSDFKIEIWSAKKGDEHLTWSSEEEAKKDESITPESMSRIEVHFREPNFKDTCVLADLSLAMQSDGSFSMTLNQVRLARFARLLKSWNLLDSNGKAIEPSLENVDRLNPEIAFPIMKKMEIYLGISDEEEQV